MFIALSRLSAVAAVFTALVPTISAAQSTTYAYDVLGRLTGVHTGPAITRYDYDAADNRTNVSACNTELPLRRWEAESLPHVIGSPETNGWRADPANGHNAMSYGPYATDIAAGSYVGVWRIKSSQVAPTDTTESITIDAFDSTTGAYLAARTIPRSAWASAEQFQILSLPFQVPASSAGHPIELRTWYSPWATITLDWIGLAGQGASSAQTWSCANVWEARSLPHVVGEASADSWASNGQAGHLVYGPYTTAIPAGRRTAYWRLMIDASTTGNQELAVLDVWDATTGATLAATSLTPQSFAQTGAWQWFSVSYDQTAGHSTEIRVRYAPPGRLLVDRVGAF